MVADLKGLGKKRFIPPPKRSAGLGSEQAKREGTGAIGSSSSKRKSDAPCTTSERKVGF